MNRNRKAFFANVLYSPLGDKIAQWLRIPQLYADYIVWRAKRKYKSIGEKEFSKGTTIGSLDDFKQAVDKHWVTYNEYAYQYEFYSKTEEEREEFISSAKMTYFYRRYVPGKVKAISRNKNRFLTKYSKYIHRNWIYTPEASYEEFAQILSNYDCIIKPCDRARGHGIYKIFKNSDHANDRKMYDSCVKDRMLVEQCIESCEELKALHPQSLNTIRVVTIANKDKACVFSGVLRSGIGDMVVDNSHNGGLSAQINVENGVVETDGANTKGERFVNHPDSGIVFKGFKIPQWDLIVKTCCEAAKMTDNPITGWDVAINSNGDVEFVEANYAPDMDMMQTRYKTGAKKKIYTLIKEYCGIELK